MSAADRKALTDGRYYEPSSWQQTAKPVIRFQDPVAYLSEVSARKSVAGR